MEAISAPIPCTPSTSSCPRALTCPSRTFSAALSDLKEFLAIRENNAIFDNAKKNGGLGIPCFVLEDGTRTLDITKVIG